MQKLLLAKIVWAILYLGGVAQHACLYMGAKDLKATADGTPILFICSLDLRSAVEVLVCDNTASLTHLV